MASWFSGNGFALAANAGLCFIFVRAVTEGSAIAASHAVTRPGAISIVAPTIGTRKVRKHGKITVTGSESIGYARRKRA